jgi:hypothetical protein
LSRIAFGHRFLFWMADSWKDGSCRCSSGAHPHLVGATGLGKSAGRIASAISGGPNGSKNAFPTKDYLVCYLATGGCFSPAIQVSLPERPFDPLN